MDDATATALYAANLGWRDVPAADLVPLDVPARLGHDVRTGGLAESVLGAGREIADFLFLPIGTGIAGAMIIGGEPYGGTSGWGGEIGHIPVFPDGEACACGQIGCLETYASASAVGRRYSARAGSPATAEEIAALTAAGDPVATEVWDEAVEALSWPWPPTRSCWTLRDRPGRRPGRGRPPVRPLAARLAERLAFRAAPAPPGRPRRQRGHAGRVPARLARGRIRARRRVMVARCAENPGGAVRLCPACSVRNPPGA
nr:hypothetical protein GCM10020093_044230 [Planobispora longispora]